MKVYFFWYILCKSRCNLYRGMFIVGKTVDLLTRNLSNEVFEWKFFFFIVWKLI